MKVEIKTDPRYQEPLVLILTDRITGEVEALRRRLTEETRLTGWREGKAVPLKPERLVRCFTEGGRVFAATERETYLLHLRLYELERQLSSRRFLRISNSELVNLEMVQSFDLSMAGTIRVFLAGGQQTYVSRRYVKRIKQVLKGGK